LRSSIVFSQLVEGKSPHSFQRSFASSVCFAEVAEQTGRTEPVVPAPPLWRNPSTSPATGANRRRDRPNTGGTSRGPVKNTPRGSVKNTPRGSVKNTPQRVVLPRPTFGQPPPLSSKRSVYTKIAVPRLAMPARS